MADFAWVLDYIPFGNNGLALILVGLVGLVLLKIVTRLAFWALIALGIAWATGLVALDQYLGFGSAPRWVLIANDGQPHTAESAHVPQMEQDLKEGTMPACDAKMTGTYAICYTDGWGFLGQSSVCTYQKTSVLGALGQLTDARVYQCK
ncbi:MAG TPA: hypothetical protein DCL54_00260 [Alphaproteobacteria bacterium]|nr:hypothetical protein [Alphaproteobacteria bacterium]